MESRFSGEFSWMNQTVGSIADRGLLGQRRGPGGSSHGNAHAVVGLFTQCFLSPQAKQGSSNPVNDTRVAVFWEAQPYIFTLGPDHRTSSSTVEKTAAQLVKVTTGNEGLDKANASGLVVSKRRITAAICIRRLPADLVNSTKRH